MRAYFYFSFFEIHPFFIYVVANSTVTNSKSAMWILKRKYESSVWWRYCFLPRFPGFFPESPNTPFFMFLKYGFSSYTHVLRKVLNVWNCEFSSAKSRKLVCRRRFIISYCIINNCFEDIFFLLSCFPSFGYRSGKKRQIWSGMWIIHSE